MMSGASASFVDADFLLHVTRGFVPGKRAPGVSKADKSKARTMHLISRARI